MNGEENEAMRTLDTRLRKALAGLDAAGRFEERLQARLAALAAAREVPDAALMRAKLEREHERRRTAANQAALVDGVAVAIAGIGGLVAAWRYAPGFARLYAAVEQAAGPAAIGLATLALTGAVLWALLRRLDVNLAALAGGRPWNATTS